eukprot:3646081-Ditylum_brightwellii.AAC.2
MKNAPSKIKIKPGSKNEQGYKDKSGRITYRRPVTRCKKFKGKIPDLKGHIYNTAYALQADLYMHTTNKIAHYAGRTCHKADDIKKAIEKLEEIEFLAPTLKEVKVKNGHTETNKMANTIAAIFLNKEIDQYIKHREAYQENKTKMFTVIISQCTDLIISKLESYPSWTNIEDESNVLELLTTIKRIAYK